MIAGLICLLLLVALVRWICADAARIDAEAWNASRPKQDAR